MPSLEQAALAGHEDRASSAHTSKSGAGNPAGIERVIEFENADNWYEDTRVNKHHRASAHAPNIQVTILSP